MSLSAFALLLHFILPLCLKWNNIHWRRLCFLLLLITHQIIPESSLGLFLIIWFDLCLGNRAFFAVLS